MKLVGSGLNPDRDAEHPDATLTLDLVKGKY